MKMVVLKIIVTLIAIIAVVLVVAIFTKKKYTITKAIIINKPKQEVFDYIKLLKNQKEYSKWLSFDPNTKLIYKGTTDGTPGSILSFESEHKKTGKGEWETKRIINGEKIDFELRFLAPFVFTANGNMSTEAISTNETKLNWVYNSGMNWPMNFMLLFMDMDKIIGTDMAESLANIKGILEK